MDTKKTPVPNQRLLEERLRRSWSQRALATLLETTEVNVSRWERGITSPGPYFRLKLCDLFEKTPEELGLVQEKEVFLSDQSVSKKGESVEPPDPPPPSGTNSPSSLGYRPSRRKIITGIVGAAVGTGATALALIFSHQHQPPAQVSPPFVGKTFVVYSGHSDLVKVVIWSPDDHYLISAGSDTTVQVWEAATGRTIHIYRGHSQTVWALALSPDGTIVASGGDDTTVQLWETATGKTLGMYRGHSGAVHGLLWSRDGTRLVSSSDDKTVQIWQAKTRDHILTYNQHTAKVWPIRWSPDETRIASGSYDSTVQVWNATTGERFYTYSQHTGHIHDLAWSRNGARIVSGDHQGQIKVWDAYDGQSTFYALLTGGSVSAVNWSPKGEHLAYVSGKVYIINATTQQLVYTSPLVTTGSMAWSHTGTHIASTDDDTTIHVWQSSS